MNDAELGSTPPVRPFFRILAAGLAMLFTCALFAVAGVDDQTWFWKLKFWIMGIPFDALLIYVVIKGKPPKISATRDRRESTWMI